MTDEPKELPNGLQLQKLVWSADNLTPTEKLFLLAIGERLGKNDTAFPGFGDIAELTGLGRSTVIRTRHKLETKGLITVTGEGQESNTYRPNWEQISALARPPKRRRRNSVTVTPSNAELVSGRHHPSVTVTPPLVSGRHHPSVTVTPERPRERPLERSKGTPPSEKAGGGSSSQEQGRQCGNQLTPANNSVKLLIKEAEQLLFFEVGGNIWHETTSDPLKVTAAIETMITQLWLKKGRYPTPKEIYYAISGEKFTTIRNLSWGWLCRRDPDGNQPSLRQLEQELANIMDLNDVPVPVRNHQFELLQELKAAIERQGQDTASVDEMIAQSCRDKGR